MRISPRFASAVLALSVTASLTAAPAVAADDAPSVRTLSLRGAATHLKGFTSVPGTVRLDGDYYTAPTTQVRVDGVLKGSLYLAYGDHVDYRAEWGAGSVVLGPTTFTTASGKVVDDTRSRAFRVRYGLDPYRSLTASRDGSLVRLHASKVRFFERTRYVSAHSALLQVKRDGRWVTLRRISLNSNGGVRLSVRSSATRSYRVHLGTTTLRQGGSTPVARR